MYIHIYIYIYTYVCISLKSFPTCSPTSRLCWYFHMSIRSSWSHIRCKRVNTKKNNIKSENAMNRCLISLETSIAFSSFNCSSCTRFDGSTIFSRDQFHEYNRLRDLIQLGQDVYDPLWRRFCPICKSRLLMIFLAFTIRYWSIFGTCHLPRLICIVWISASRISSLNICCKLSIDVCSRMSSQ